MNLPKIRAWDKESKFMTYGEIEYFDDSVSYRFNHFTVGSNYEVILMQYTGLKDKNGVEIFEGDAIRTVSGNIQVVVFVIGSTKRNQDSRIAQFNCYDSRGYFHFDRNDEVIGNIHANPELKNEVE